MFQSNFRKIKRRSHEIEPQETFLDKLAQKKEQDFGFSGKKFEVPLSQQKLKIFYIIFLLISVFFISKTIQYQIIKGEEYLAMAERNKQGLRFEQALRGVIYDNSLEQLVFNKSSYDLIINVKDLPRSEREAKGLIDDLSVLLSRDLSELEKEIKETELNVILVEDNLDHETLVLLGTKIDNFPGFEIKESTIRDYKEGEFYSHIVGFTGKIGEEIKELEGYSVIDYVGKQGIEKFYEEVLRGKPAKILVERDALGNRLSEETISNSEQGNSLVLWLDAGLQKKLTQALMESMEKVGSEKGAAVAIDPRTGGILAMVSLPSFDNNLFSKGISSADLAEISQNPNNPLFNRIISGGYPVGSTIKPLMGSAILEEGILSANENILCEGEISIPNPYYPDQPSIYRDVSVHGWTNLRKAIAESCNVYFYITGGGYKDIEGLGVDRIKKYLELFGWGYLTGIDLPGERRGRVPDPEWKENYFDDYQRKIWRVGDTYNLSIGQGDISITPLQVAVAFSSIANRGTLYQPQVVKQLVEGSSSDLRTIKEFEPKIIREGFINPENLEAVREGMREAVEYGSSNALSRLSVQVASKTGTAQTSRIGIHHNWVSVFAPYDDPEIVITVIVENVEGLQFSAIPVAREALAWYFGEEAGEEKE
jgi:penicillin-binding protein 2